MADYTNSAPATAGNRLLANLIDGLVAGALASVVGAILGNTWDSLIGQLLALIYRTYAKLNFGYFKAIEIA